LNELARLALDASSSSKSPSSILDDGCLIELTRDDGVGDEAEAEAADNPARRLCSPQLLSARSFGALDGGGADWLPTRAVPAGRLLQAVLLVAAVAAVSSRAPVLPPEPPQPPWPTVAEDDVEDS
jgi:hypothetical protein